MRVAVSAWLALLASSSGALATAANIDSGFVQDGTTTYCQGVRGATANPLEFLELEAHNAGRCPIDVTLSVAATTVGTQSPLQVQWAASVHAGDVPNNIFPRAVDAATKKPQDVISSILRACKAGTNCAPEGIVVPQVVGPVDAETGSFDAAGRKPLRAHQFLFTDAGHYVVVGVVVLPGDAMLNVSASEFIAFQRITVVEGVGPATVSPSLNAASPDEVGAEGVTANINFQTDLVKSNSTTEPPKAALATTESGSMARSPGGVDAAFAGSSTKTNASASAGGNSKLDIMLVAIGATVLLLAVLLYFVVIKKRRRTVNSKDPKKPLASQGEAGIFRLTLSGNNDMASSLSIATLPRDKDHATAGSASVYSGGSSQRSLAPPRFTVSSQASSSTSSASSGPFNRPTRSSSNQSNQFASGKEFQANRKQSQRHESIVSLASSRFSDYSDNHDGGAFGDLHDSAEALPVVRRQSSRGSTASSRSSASSYGGAYDQHRASSRLYSEGSVQHSDFGASYSDRDSDFGGSNRSTELGALSERGTRRGEYEV